MLGMFVFAVWIMPPLYDAFCDITGINGKTRGKYEEYEAVPAVADTSRTVQVRFVANNKENMPWEFGPAEALMKVHPGEAIVTHFVAHNPTDKVMVAQAVPSMVPHNATDYFLKTECFCFNQQVLGPGESAELALKFVVDQEMPKKVNSIVLSYSLFDITEDSPEAVQQKREEITNVQRALNNNGLEQKLITRAN